MTVQDRHNDIAKILADMKAIHEKYFPAGRPMTDEEWTEAINAMQAILAQWENTSLYDFADNVHMAFLEDLELVHKAWKKRQGGTDAIQKTE